MEFKNPFKLTPGTIENDKYNTRPLMTNENSPKVKKVIGNEKNCMTGLTTTLRQPNIIVNIIKEARELMQTLDIRLEIMYREIALIMINNDILFILTLLSIIIIELIYKNYYQEFIILKKQHLLNLF